MTEPDLQHFNHADRRTPGVLLVNLGTPEAPDRASVRRYLKEFLWDPRVVEVPRLVWWFVLNGLVLNTRPGRSAKAYQKVWTDEGSPLLSISRRQQAALVEALRSRFGREIPVALGMRYGQPSIAGALQELRDRHVDRVVVLPLYPQYSATTTASIFDAVTAELRRWRWIPELRFVNHYHDHPLYIDALTDSVRRFRAEHGGADMLLMSFHGIPQDYFHAGDPYYCECQKTGRLLASRLGLDKDHWRISFQSRLGPRQWLEPYTDRTLDDLPGEGVSSVQVICPGFSADCLETLEEIAMENADVFQQAGGERYEYIPCLNDEPRHIDMLATLLSEHMQGWDLEDTAADDTLAFALAKGARQ